MFFFNPALQGARLSCALCTFLSPALLFLSEAQPASAEAAPPESFAMVTMFLEPEGKCLEANFGDHAFQSTCDYKEGQFWLSRPAADGASFQLVTDIFPDLCLQASFGEGDSLEAQGAAFLKQCSDAPGQKWLFIDGGTDGYFHLKNYAGGADYCLEGNRPGRGSVLGGHSFLDKCQNVTGQFWRVPGAAVIDGIPYSLETIEDSSDEAAPDQSVPSDTAADSAPATAPETLPETSQDGDGSPAPAPAESDVTFAPEAVPDDVPQEGFPAEPAGDTAAADFAPAVVHEPGPAVPAMTALQSCSVNDGVCEPGVARGYYMAAAPDSTGYILPLEADEPKPQLVVEHYPQEDGKVAVAFRDSQGRYLVIDPNNGFSASFASPTAADDNTRFLVVAALDSPEQGFASFVPLLYPEKYLRHSGFVLFAHDSDNSSLFRRDASWRIVGLE